MYCVKYGDIVVLFVSAVVGDAADAHMYMPRDVRPYRHRRGGGKRSTRTAAARPFTAHVIHSVYSSSRLSYHVEYGTVVIAVSGNADNGHSTYPAVCFLLNRQGTWTTESTCAAADTHSRRTPPPTRMVPDSSPQQCVYRGVGRAL